MDNAHWPTPVSFGDPLGEMSEYVVEASYGNARATVRVEAANAEHAIAIVARERSVSFVAREVVKP